MATFSNEILVATGAADVREVATADLNGDGRLDLLSASFGDDTIAWYENSGPPAPGLGLPGLSFSSRQIISTNAAGAVAVEAADLDDDGDQDVASASFDDNKLAWYENMGGGSFGPQQVITTSGNLPADIDAADLDNDGDNDLALISNFGLLWAENVSAGFQVNTIVQGQSVIDGGFAVHAADLDNDGDQDLLTTASRDGKVAWHENTGGGTFGAQQVITTNAPSGADVNAADLDGDGDLDVLSASGDGPDDRIAWYENQGGGSFGSQQVISTEQGSPSAVQAADLDLDGDQDLVTAAVADDRVAQFENMAGSSFGPFQSLTNDADEAADVSLADLDGDGDVDVAQASRGDNTVSVFQNQTLQDAVNRISFKFGEFGGNLNGEFGGNLNMEVNGDFRNFGNFQDVAGATIGGASVAVTNGFGDDMGTVTLSGTAIGQFRIGGQELWLDDIAFGNAANPAATVTFSNPQPAQPTYSPGAGFSTAAGVDVTVEDFVFADGTTFTGGTGQTSNNPTSNAGGTGQDFNTNNVTLNFDVESAVTGEELVIPDRPDGTGDSWGDPHLVTFDGLAYDFQAAGEFNLVSSGDGSLTVQVRQEPIGNSPVAVNTALATEIGGTRIGLYAGQDNPLEIDNQTVALDVVETMAVGNGIVSRNEGRFTIVLPGEDGQLNDGDPQLIVDVFGNHVDVEVRVPDSLSDELSGLLGDFDGDPNNDPQFPDGDPLCDPRFCDPPNPTFPTGILYEEFADSHRIGDQASLFNYEQGESNQGFQMPDFPGEAFTVEDLGTDVRQQAEMAAENAGLEPGTTAFDNAVLDFGVTQDNSFFSGALGAPTPAVTASLTSLGGIDVFPTDGLATTEAGGTDTFDVVLTRQPSDDVTINLASDDTTEGTASPNTLVFTPNNFDTPQSVTVTGVDDTIPDGDQQYAIVTAPAMSSDPSFNGLNPFDVVLMNFDDEDFVVEIPSPPVNIGDSWGDPHIVTFDGQAYDFQDAGEFTLALSDTGDVNIQVRQEPIGNSPVAVNTAVATEIGGTRVGLYVGQDNPLEIGNDTIGLDDGEVMAVGNGAVSRDGDTFTIVLPGEDGQLNDGDPRLRADIFDNHMDIEVLVPDNLSDEINGLLGDLDGDPANDPQFPGGDPLCDPRFCDPPNPTFPTSELYGPFAEAWRVDESESLFNYEQGESNAGFLVPDFPGESFTAEDLDPDVRQEAEAAAEEAGLEPGTPQFDAAVLDFGVTQDPSFFEGASTAPEAQSTASNLDLEDQARDIFRFFNTVAKGHFFTIDEGERDFVQNNLPEYDFEGVGFEALPPDADNGVSTDVFRFFNTEARGHFFTTSVEERDFVIENLPQFQPEGVGFEAFDTQIEGTVPVFRFFNTQAEGHFFTTSEAERDFVQENLPQFNFEGTGFFAFPDAIA